VIPGNVQNFEKKNPDKCIDFRFEDHCFPVFAGCVTISNPDLLPSCTTGVDPGMKVEKSLI
jgi:hypothetical protein